MHVLALLAAAAGFALVGVALLVVGIHTAEPRLRADITAGFRRDQ